MSEVKREDRYIQFPLCLLQQTYQNPKQGLNMILDYGIVYYAKSIRNYTITEVARQLMYAFYRKNEMIQNSLYSTIQKYANNGCLTIDEDYNGFSGSSFDPLEVSEELLGLFESDHEFKKAAILRYQIAQAEDFLYIKDHGIDSTIKGYKEGLAYQKEFEQKFGSDCMPMIKPEQLFEFRDSGRDLDLFRAYIAIKSMIGMRNFATSNKPAILSRMIGCKSKDAFVYYTTNKYQKNDHILPTVKKYSKRFNMDKLILTLAERQFIMFVSKPYVSILYFSKYMEPEELATLVKETKSKQDLKQRIKEASKFL
ncbi:MAG: hypothetical protein HXX14_01820 [Bacteroidetes bacterium]|nr:hypothetical protein [Bacteroidota bacterium]